MASACMNCWWYNNRPPAVIEGLCQECYDEHKDHRCPLCGSICLYDSACPTYRRTDENGNVTWWSCYPPCGNATEWMCTNDLCDWFYIAGTNNPSRNKFEPTSWSRDVINEGFRDDE